MWAVKYVSCFVCEFVLIVRQGRNCISSLGHKQGSWSAVISFCHTVAKFVADNNHPLKYCFNRTAWVKWMNQY
jgi:hypothetical protein